MTDSEDSSSSSSDEENVLKIEKKYIDEAIKLIYGSGDEERFSPKFNVVKGPKAIRECRQPGLQSLGICSSAGERSTLLLLKELHACLARHDFHNATTCLNLLLNKSNSVLPITWKVSFLILLNHPNSNKDILQDFLQICVGLRHVPQMQIFLEELLSLPADLEPLSKYSRIMKIERFL